MMLGSGGVDTTVNLTVNGDAEIGFLVNPRYPDAITLVIGATAAEITFHPSTVKALRDKADDALLRLAVLTEHGRADAGELVVA